VNSVLPLIFVFFLAKLMLCHRSAVNCYWFYW